MDREIGFTSIRVPMYWDDVDPQANGTYDFTAYENAIKSIVAAGLQPVIVALTTHSKLASTQWGAGGLGFPVTQSDMNLYATYVAAAAKDFQNVAPSNLVIEIGNEPNLLSNNVTRADSYTALYKLCRKTALSNVKLAGPVVSTFQDGSSSTVPSTTYAERCVLSDGLRPDIFTVHLYNGIGAPSALIQSEQRLLAIARGIPFWITECGYPSGPQGNSNAVSQGQQAYNLNYEARTFTAVGAAKVFFYDDRDTEGWCTGTGNASCVDPAQTSSPQEGYFGLMDHSRNLKPSGEILKNYIHSQGEAPLFADRG
jgi:hypothetical protein